MKLEIWYDAHKDQGNVGLSKDASVIGVDAYIARYGVENPRVAEVLRKYPELCYLLGRVTDAPQGYDSRPDLKDGKTRPVYYLIEGSGMFGLTNPDDAMRWKGIFNHVMGTSRQVYWLTDRLKNLDPAHRQALIGKGFDFAELDRVTPELLRDFMFISHAGRRQMDEYNWHGLRDTAHPSGESGPNTLDILKAAGADQRYLDFMRIEDHPEHLAQAANSGKFPNMVDNILTWADWTFGQQSEPLNVRFVGLRARQRAEPHVLNVLELCGQTFERELNEALGGNIFAEMQAAAPYTWEQEIREAYCAPSGLSPETVFRGYFS